jgi:hypothetical protein
VWLAQECEYLLRYEVDTYNTIRPVAYTNWPTLDPLSHPTETTLKEEAVLRPWVPPELPHEFDNDAIGLDAVKMRATAANPAGSFASYHAYPYYPDFLVLDPGYAKARSPEGASNYFGYLRELVEHHGDMPVMISEYGVPSSRGNAHVQPQGWNHGGHSETEQAEIDARLTRDIHAVRGGRGGALRGDRRVVQEELDRDRLRAAGGAEPALAQSTGRGTELRHHRDAGRLEGFGDHHRRQSVGLGRPGAHRAPHGPTGRGSARHSGLPGYVG